MYALNCHALYCDTQRPFIANVKLNVPEFPINIKQELKILVIETRLNTSFNHMNYQYV